YDKVSCTLTWVKGFSIFKLLISLKLFYFHTPTGKKYVSIIGMDFQICFVICIENSFYFPFPYLHDNPAIFINSMFERMGKLPGPSNLYHRKETCSAIFALRFCT